MARNYPGRETWIPVTGFLVAVSLLWVAWAAADRRQREAIVIESERHSREMAIRLEDCLSIRLHLLHRIRDNWISGESNTEASFATQAEAVQGRFSGIVAINWVDPEGRIRWLNPREGNEAARGRNLLEHPRAARYVLRARDTGSLQITPPLDLYQGGVGFAAYIPLWRDGVLEGYVNAAFRGTALVDACSSDGMRDEFDFTLADGGRSIHRHVAGEGKIDDPYRSVQEVRVGDRRWQLNLWPSPHHLQSSGIQATRAIAALGLLMALGLTFVARALLQHRAAVVARLARDRQLLEEMPARVCRARADGTLTFANEAYSRAFGMTPDELEGRNVRDLQPAVDGAKPPGGQASLSPENPTQSDERQEIDERGVTRWIHWRQRAVFDEEGRLDELQSVGVDTTESRATREALRGSEERFREIFRVISDAIFIFDVDGKLLEANERACDLYGLTLDELLCLKPDDLGPDSSGDPSRHGGAFAWFRRVVWQREPSLFEWESVDGQGRRWWAEIQLRQLDLDRQPRVLAVVRDVTQRRELEQQLRQSQKMEAVGTLAAGVAHDINNTLTAIVGHAGLARTTPGVDPDLRRHLEGIESACVQATRVTRSLLTFSRSTESRRHAIDARALVSSTVDMLRPILPDAVEVKVDVPEHPVSIEADPAQIQQVVMNLAVNARDAMPGGGELRIALRSPSGEASADLVELSITDSGVGMDPDVLQRVTEPFFTTKPRGHGTGLGMAVVHGIVSEHGGRLNIESEKGRGTRVVVTLPRCEAPGAAEEPVRQVANTEIGSGRILLAEDNDDVRKLIARILRSRGFDVVEARDGLAAVASASSSPDELDLLILDVDLPKMSGPEVLIEMRQAGVEASVVLISGGSEPDLEQGLPPGATFLQKPFQLGELARLAAEIIKNRPPGAAD